MFGDTPGKVNPGRLAETALALLRIPSPTGSTREITEYLAAEYRDLGADVSVVEHIPGAPEGADAPSLAARKPGTGEAPVLQLDGHCDTIPVEHSPPKLIDDVLHGRGAADMKGGLASILEVGRVIREQGLTLPGDLLFTAHGLHEAPGGHGEGLRALLAAGFRGDAAIVAEGTFGQLNIAGRGMAIFNVEITGPPDSTHENSTPPGTPHPLSAAGALLSKLESEGLRLAETERPHVGCETLFVGQVHGGDFYNRFPTRCTMQGTRRYFAGRSFEDVAGEMRAIAREVELSHGVSVNVSFDRIRDGYELIGDEPIVRAYREAWRDLEGQPVPTGAFLSVGDVSILTGEAGIPAVYCGYEGEGAHADHESVHVDALVHQARHILGTILHFHGMV